MAHKKIEDLPVKEGYPEEVDTLVIGAGMAGLYSTYQILKKDRQADILIFDASNRTGGRLNSDVITFDHVVPRAEVNPDPLNRDENAGPDHLDGKTEKISVKEEEGGMRFTFDLMDDLMALFMELGLYDSIVPFPMSSNGNNRLYFRGHSFNNKQSAENNYEIWQDLYNLQPSESGFKPNEIVNTVYNRILSANPAFDSNRDRTPEFWQQFRLDCQWKGTSLKDWTLWELFTDMGYSAESITMLYRLLGFNGTFLSSMNAGEAYQLLEDFPSEPDFKTLEEGFSMLPNALVEKINQDKSRIYLNTRLESIESLGEKDGKLHKVRYSYLPKGKTEADRVNASIRVKNLILGMPRLALEKLFMRSNALNVLNPQTAEKLWDTLQTTSNQPLLKINLYYDRAWWGSKVSGQPGVAFGPNFSDLPLGSVYPFYSLDNEVIAGLEFEKILEELNQKNGYEPSEKLRDTLDEIAGKKYDLPAALTIYCDYLNINFWKALMHVPQDLSDEEKKKYYFSSGMQEEFNSKRPQTLFPATKEVVKTATEFFKKLFNTHYVPEPVLTSARIWEGSTRLDTPPSEQFGYGVHQWALGADDRKTIEFLTEPFPGIYTCGEAFSDYQGWVEGALRSADLVLKKGWDIHPVSKQYLKENNKTANEAITEAYAKKRLKDIEKYILSGLEGKDKALAEQVSKDLLMSAQGNSPSKNSGGHKLKLKSFTQE